MLPRCAVLDDYQRVALSVADWSPLAGRVEVVVFDRHVGDPDRLAEMLADFDVIVAMRERTRFDRALLERLPKLRLLVTTGMRNASIDVAAAQGRGILVCGTESSPGGASDLTWALILAAVRHIPREVAAFRAGAPQWQRTIGNGLSGKRLGIVGTGNLGRRVARVGLAFDMAVSAWSRSLTPGRAAELGLDHCVDLDELLRQADIVSIHLALTPQTRGLIGARELALMKPTAWLVNTARGPIVDEPALIAALRDRAIAGAALDVFDEEPLPADHPFRTLDNVVATPHLGYVIEESYRVFYGHAAEDIAAWLDGRPVRVLAA